MKILSLLLLMTFISLTGFSQTKRIAFRSHSGSGQHFSLTGADNFGETPEMVEARKKKEAEAKRVADSIAQRAISDSLSKLKHKNKHKSKKKTDN